MASLPDRCSLHPHRRVVGICALCLHDRLTLLIESVSPDAACNGERNAACVQSLKPVSSAGEHPRLPLPAPRAQLLSRERSVSGFNPNGKASADTVTPHRPEKFEDSVSSALQKVKQAHQQLSFVAQSPYQGGIKLDPAASPLPNEHASLPASRRRSNSSVTDTRSFPGAMDTASSKRKGSWFSISKGKSPLSASPLPQIGRKHNISDKTGFQSSPQVAVLAGRKSASDAIGRSCNSYRQAYMAELGSISEINLGDAAIKVERNECNGDARANSSWISSLFHRRRGPRCKVDEQQDGGLNGSSAASQAPLDRLASRSPLPTFEPGRLSWDGPRPSVKQMLKRIEARKKQQRVDCSPLHSFAAPNGEGVYVEDAMAGQASALYKCKSAAASRRSTSVDTPKSSSTPANLSSMFQSDANTNPQIESCNGLSHAREPRSWGRAWNRTLSPLLGFRTYAGKSPLHSGHQHQAYANLNHVNHRNALAGAPSSANRYLSPLSRSQCGPDSQIRIAL